MFCQTFSEKYKHMDSTFLNCVYMGIMLKSEIFVRLILFLKGIRSEKIEIDFDCGDLIPSNPTKPHKP
jgi:hypothetical protein